MIDIVASLYAFTLQILIVKYCFDTYERHLEKKNIFFNYTFQLSKLNCFNRRQLVYGIRNSKKKEPIFLCEFAYCYKYIIVLFSYTKYCIS